MGACQHVIPIPDQFLSVFAGFCSRHIPHLPRRRSFRLLETPMLAHGCARAMCTPVCCGMGRYACTRAL